MTRITNEQLLSRLRVLGAQEIIRTVDGREYIRFYSGALIELESARMLLERDLLSGMHAIQSTIREVL